MKTKTIISNILARKEGEGGITSVYFVACGGSLAAMYPAKYLLESESKTLKVGYYTSNEFVYATPKACGKNSLVICCTKGGTAETIKACQKARELGAATVAVVGFEENPMVKEADEYIVFGGTAQMSKNNLALVLMMAFELLYQIEDYDKYEDAVAAYEKIESVNARGREYFAPRAKKFAMEYKDEPVIYVMGGGPTDGMAYAFEICSLIETQWMHAVKINTGEYFHGPFETTDKNLAIVLLMNDGRTRPVDERVMNFIQRYAERYSIIDAKDMGVNLFPDSVSEFFNPIAIYPALSQIVAELAIIRQHDKTVRRYMWNHVEY